MKTTYKITTVILVAGMALSACTKDIASENGTDPANPQKEGFRTIEVTFDTPTKSSLDKDGRTPKFDNGDWIIVSDGSKTEELQVKVVNGKASFTTDLTGSLRAVYPADAAKIDKGDIVGVKVPLTQSGRFKDANIAMAEIGITQTSALFKPQTAILRFYVDDIIRVNAIDIRETNGRMIAGDGDELAPEAELDSLQFAEMGKIEQLVDEGTVITVMPAEMGCTLGQWLQDRLCYVAIRPTDSESEAQEAAAQEASAAKAGVKAKDESAVALGSTYDLEVRSYTETQYPSNDGSVTKYFYSVSLPAGTLASVFIPYYINVNVGTDDEPYIQKWSYCNLGAFLPEEPGYYFSWGNTQGYVQDPASGWWVPASGTGSPLEGFTSENYENQGAGYNLSEDIPLYSPADAANFAWRSNVGLFVGGTSDDWRMPSQAEVDTLLNRFPTEGEGKDFIGNYYSSKKKGVMFTDLHGQQVFFADGRYWTTIYVNEDKAVIFVVNSSEKDLGTTPDYRWKGHPIRPIYGNPLDKSKGISINPIQKGETL